MRYRIVSLVILLMLGGCSGYELSSATKNVSVESISPHNFTVNFCGNAYMSQKEVEKYALQRAAEVTLSKGCSHFIVLKKRDDSQMCALNSSAKYEPMPSSAVSQQKDSANYIFPPFMKPNVTLTIQCFSEGETLPQNAIDAHAFLHENFPGLTK